MCDTARFSSENPSIADTEINLEVADFNEQFGHGAEAWRGKLGLRCAGWRKGTPIRALFVTLQLPSQL